MKKKIILIYIWNMDIGGVQKRVRDIVYYLDKYHQEYQIELLIKRAYNTPLLKQVKKLKRIKIHYFSTYPGKIWWPSFFWVAIKYLQLKPNTVLTFLDRLSIQMVCLKKIIFWQPVKLVLNEGIYTSTYLKMYENVFWEKLVRVCYPLADTIVVPTKAIYQDLHKNFRVPKNKIKIIPHWIYNHDSKLSHSNLKLELNKNSPPNIKIYDFIYVGRLEKEKNIFWLVDLISKLKEKYPRVSLCILGKGSLAKKLLQLIKVNNLTKNIFFNGFKDNVTGSLKKAKILLLPSKNEGMPNAVLEAAVYKIPAVINNFPGASEIITHGQTGYIAHNKKEFINYAEKLQKNSYLTQPMGNRSFDLIRKNFNQKNLKCFINRLLF